MGRPLGSKNKPKENGVDTEQHAEPGVDALDTMAAETLRGDIALAILTEFKAIQHTWNLSTEDEQKRLIARAQDIAEQLVNRAVTLAGAEGAPHVIAEIDQFVVKDGLKIVMKASGAVDHVLRLAEHHGPAVLVLIDPAKFKGQRVPLYTDNVGDLKMPRNGAGVRGDELPGKDEANYPGPRRLPPPGDFGDAPFMPGEQP